jgi:hypothetical protein
VKTGIDIKAKENLEYHDEKIRASMKEAKEYLALGN